MFGERWLFPFYPAPGWEWRKEGGEGEADGKWRRGGWYWRDWSEEEDEEEADGLLGGGGGGGVELPRGSRHRVSPPTEPEGCWAGKSTTPRA